MTARRRQWLIAASTLLAVLAITLAWVGYLQARSTPHWRQTEPGAMVDPMPEGGMPMRLTSLTVSSMLVTDRGDQPAPAGAVWVVAVIDYLPPPEGSHCGLVLLATDGRQWSSTGALDFEGSRGLQGGCPLKPGEGTPRGEQVYLIPADAADSLAGLAAEVTAYRGTAPYPVLTPGEVR